MSIDQKEYHIKALAEATFILVGSGETYFTEEVPGEKLLERVLANVEGEPAREERKEIWKDDLEDPEQWWYNEGLPDIYYTEVGETDRLQLFRITHK